MATDRYFKVYNKDTKETTKVRGVPELAKLVDVPIRLIPSIWIMKVTFGKNDTFVVREIGSNE